LIRVETGTRDWGLRWSNRAFQGQNRICESAPCWPDRLRARHHLEADCHGPQPDSTFARDPHRNDRRNLAHGIIGLSIGPIILPARELMIAWIRADRLERALLMKQPSSSRQHESAS
jgi:hypothetical protein